MSSQYSTPSITTLPAERIVESIGPVSCGSVPPPGADGTPITVISGPHGGDASPNLK